MKGESSAHGFIDCLADSQLGETALRPETLQNLATMFDLNKGTRLIVAATPERSEFLARFHGPGF